jgi:DNA-binding CsgD family transcriptional regulator
MAAEQRVSGIPLLDDVPWGSHLCVFYDSISDLGEIAAAYFEAGLQHNEFCVWLVPQRLTLKQAGELLRANVDDFDRQAAEGHMQLVASADAVGEAFDPKRMHAFWDAKLDQALASGYDGLRAAGDSAAPERSGGEPLMRYERELAHLLNENPVLALCTYALDEARAVDVLDILRTHNVTVARRGGEWQFLETPELQRAKAHIRNLDDALAIMAVPFPGRELLTERERMVLAFLVKGASSKEAARDLGISPRTVDFHRANIIEKLGARNTADAISRVLSRGRAMP